MLHMSFLSEMFVYDIPIGDQLEMFLNPVKYDAYVNFFVYTQKILRHASERWYQHTPSMKESFNSKMPNIVI